MVYNPAEHQPLRPYFDLEIGNLKRIYEYPEVPSEFELKLSLDGLARVEFDVFDVTGADIEPEIWRSIDPNTGVPTGYFEFGFIGGKRSDRYQFQIDEYIPESWNNGYMIKIKGFCPTYTPIMSNNQLSGTLEDVIKEFCEIHRLDYKIDPPFGPTYMKDVGYNDNKNTELMEMRHHKWVNETDMAYLERILSWARDQEGKGGYRWHISPEGDNNGTLCITLPKNQGTKHKYVVQDKDTVVIKWSPVVSFNAAAFGANDIQQVQYERSTGDELKVVNQQQLTERYQCTGGLPNSAKVKSLPSKEDADKQVYTNTENMPQNVTSAIRIRPGASVSAKAGTNPTINAHLLTWMNSFTGTLHILGDPGLKLNMDGSRLLVDIVNYWPVNPQNRNAPRKIHYTSGIYWVYEIRHTISDAGFETYLEVERANSETPESSGK